MARNARMQRTGRAVLLTMAAALLILPVLLIAHPIAYVPLVSAVLLVVASWLYLQALRGAILVRMDDMASSCERGHNASLSVRLVNRAPIPCARISMDFYVTDLFGGYDDVRKLTCSVGARRDVTVDFDVRFAHLGTYYAGVSCVVVHDLLGLFSMRLRDGVRRQVVVSPQRVRMGQPGSLTAVPDENNRALKAVAADDVDYASVREYRFGDSMKTVHWNLSARDPHGTMYTRLYEAYVNPSLSVVIDSYAKGGNSNELMSLFDGMIETAASLCEQARAAGIDAEVRYVDRGGVPSSIRLATRADADDLVSDIMAITAVSGKDSSAGAAEEMLREAGLRSHASGNIALVTARPDAALVTTLVEITMSRRNAMAFLAVPRDLTERDREKYTAPMRRLTDAGGAWWAIESNEVATVVVGL